MTSASGKPAAADRRPGGLEGIDAVILAGGLGSRLRSVIDGVPKPMADIGGRPFLDLLVETLLRHGARRVIFCVGHRRENIIAHYSAARGAEFLFSEETAPLGTGGALRHAAPLLRGDPVLVLNGDSYCPVDYEDFLSFHRARGAVLSMVVAAARGRVDGGTVEIADDGRIARFREKSAAAGAGRAYINAGIYLLPRDEAASWRQPDPFSLERDVFPALVASRPCYGYAVDAEVVDIGTPERYAAARSRAPESWR